MRLSVLPDIRRTTFSIPYLCHTYLNKRECCQTYSNLDCHKSDGFLALTDNRAKLHGLMRNAMERVSVPIKKGEGCATLFTFDDDR